MRTTLTIIVSISILISLICIAGCSAPESSDSQSENRLQISDDNLMVHKFGGDVLQGTASVNGKARNISSSTIDSASISVNFYDKNGKIINTSSATAQNLEVGEIWNFNIQCTGPDMWKIVKYDITVSIK